MGRISVDPYRQGLTANNCGRGFLLKVGQHVHFVETALMLGVRWEYLRVPY